MHTTRWSRRQIIAAGTALCVSAALSRSVIAQNASPQASPAATSYPVTVTHDDGETVIEQEP